jgi:hypothetical protein
VVEAVVVPVMVLVLTIGVLDGVDELLWPGVKDAVKLEEVEGVVAGPVVV